MLQPEHAADAGPALSPSQLRSFMTLTHWRSPRTVSSTSTFRRGRPCCRAASQLAQTSLATSRHRSMLPIDDGCCLSTHTSSWPTAYSHLLPLDTAQGLAAGRQKRIDVRSEGLRSPWILSSMIITVAAIRALTDDFTSGIAFLRSQHSRPRKASAASVPSAMLQLDLVERELQSGHPELRPHLQMGAFTLETSPGASCLVIRFATCPERGDRDDSLSEEPIRVDTGRRCRHPRLSFLHRVIKARCRTIEVDCSDGMTLAVDGQ